MDYEKYIDASLKTMRPKKLTESALYPDKVVGRLWQISAQYPGYAPELLVLRKGKPVFVTTFMKSNLKAVCFLSKADAEEYASTLTAPRNSTMQIKQSPKNKLCVSHSEIVPGAYVVEKTDINKVDINGIPFINKDGKIVTSKDDSYIKLTPGNVSKYILEPLEDSLRGFLEENVTVPLRKIFSEIPAEESTKHFVLPDKFTERSSLVLRYREKPDQISIDIFADYKNDVLAPDGFEWGSAELSDAARTVSHRYFFRAGWSLQPGVGIGDNSLHIYYTARRNHTVRPNFLDKVRREVSLAEIADMKEELKVIIEDWVKDTFSEKQLVEIKKDNKERIHEDMAAIEAVLPQFEYEEI